MLRPGDLVVLTGALGAGKTTLTRGIAAGLGVRGPVQSPTFVIARTHPSLVGGAPLVHVDAYRLGLCARTRRPRHRRGPLGRHRRVGPRHGRRAARRVVGDRARARARRARRRHDVRRPLARCRRSSTPTRRASSRCRGGRSPAAAPARATPRAERRYAAGSEAADRRRLAAASPPHRGAPGARRVAAIAASTASGRSTFAK